MPTNKLPPNPSYRHIWFSPERVISQKWNVGTTLRVGFRTGPFTNKLVLNLPFGKIPATVAFQTAIGLNVRKWWEKSEEPVGVF